MSRGPEAITSQLLEEHQRAFTNRRLGLKNHMWHIGQKLQILLQLKNLRIYELTLLQYQYYQHTNTNIFTIIPILVAQSHLIGGPVAKCEVSCPWCQLLLPSQVRQEILHLVLIYRFFHWYPPPFQYQKENPSSSQSHPFLVTGFTGTAALIGSANLAGW